MNKRTHFFIKIYLSLFILERVDVGCVWEVSWRRGQTAISIQSSSDYSSTSFASWLGCSSVGHWGPQAVLTLATCPQLTPTASGTRTDWPKPSVAPGYIIVLRPPASCGRTHLPNSTMSTGQGDIPMSSTGCTCFAFPPLIYTGASLDWRLGQGSICYIKSRTAHRSKYCCVYIFNECSENHSLKSPWRYG